MVDVGGRSLYIHCEGEGSPAIILVPGEKDSSSTIWEISDLFRKLAATTLTCAYDSPGYGKSDSAPQPRTAQDATDDLHMLLTIGQIPGPYILVGHAFGGWPTILYAAQFSEEVVGMVLMEPYHPDIGYRWSAAFPTASPYDSRYVIGLRKIVNEWYNEDYVIISSEQVRAVTSLGDLPLFVITNARGYTVFGPEVNQAMNETSWAASEELAALSTNSKWIKIEDSSYIIWEQKPEEVVRAIREMVELTRK
jgi:pimeloyl-ACP methyl ester carboxylesterase